MTSIFNLKELDFVGYGQAFGLVRLPRMPELKNRKDIPEGGWLTSDVDVRLLSRTSSVAKTNQKLDG